MALALLGERRFGGEDMCSGKWIHIGGLSSVVMGMRIQPGGNGAVTCGNRHVSGLT